MPVLDTNFLIALRAGDVPAQELLAQLRQETLLVPSVAAVEFLTPFGRSAEEAYRELARSFTIAHTDADWVVAASGLRARLHEQKRSLRLADFWIAAFAVLHDTFVVTRNVKDFEAMGVAARAW